MISQIIKAIKEAGNLIPDRLSNSKNNLLIALYIVEKFDNKLNNSEDSDKQIEYILFGNEKISSNNSYVNTSIFSLRFLLNSNIFLLLVLTSIDKLLLLLQQLQG